jgi:hypothetical protein
MSAQLEKKQSRVVQWIMDFFGKSRCSNATKSHHQLTFDSLPNEVQLKIFSYFKYRFRDLSAMRQVCRQWNQLITTEKCMKIERLVIDEDFILASPFFRHIAIDGSLKVNKNIRRTVQQAKMRIGSEPDQHRRVLDKFIKHASTRFEESTRSITVSHFLRTQLKIRNLSYLDYQHCLGPSLSAIDLSHVDAFDFNYNLQEKFRDQVRALDFSHAQVVDAMFHEVYNRCPHLECLTLRHSTIEGYFLKIYLTEPTQALRYLDLRSCRIMRFLLEFLEKYHNLTHFYIDEYEEEYLIGPILRNHLQLTSLQIALNPASFVLLEYNCEKMFARLELLTELNIAKSWCTDDLERLVDQTVAKILNVCTRLKIFNVNFCGQVSDAAFTSKPVKAPLVELHVYETSLTRLTFNCLAEKSQLKSSLKTLNISKCRNLNQEDMSWIVGTFEMLTKIEISFNNLPNMKCWLKQISKHPKRHFNLFGFADIPDEICEYLRKKKTRLRLQSVAYKNFRIHFKNMADEIVDRHEPLTNRN